MTTTQRTDLGRLLRRLAMPIFVPTVLYSAGAAAIVPVVPFAGLQLGLTVPQVALLGTAAGVLVVVGPIPMGYVVARIGERAGLLLGGAVSLISIIGCIVAVNHTGAGSSSPDWASALFVVCILTMAVGDLTWDLGRQTYLADEIPVEFRARAMTLFGGMLRVGRVIGPLAGAAAISLGGMTAPFWVHLGAAVFGLVTIAIFVPPRHARTLGDGAGSEPPTTRREIMRPIVLVGVAVLVLVTLRSNRDLLLPLLGHAFGHSPQLVSLIFAASSVAELLLIIPAGTLMDRFGRAAVLVPCLVGMGIAFLMAPLAATTAGFIAVSFVCAIGNGIGAGINKTLSADVTPAVDRARWMGVWNSLVGAGALVGPGIITAATAASGVVAAAVITGAVGVAGAAWAVWWVPRYAPRGHLRTAGTKSTSGE